MGTPTESEHTRTNGCTTTQNPASNSSSQSSSRQHPAKRIHLCQAIATHSVPHRRRPDSFWLRRRRHFSCSNRSLARRGAWPVHDPPSAAQPLP